jgi:hypothetical protein
VIRLYKPPLLGENEDKKKRKQRRKKGKKRKKRNKREVGNTRQRKRGR